MHFPLQDNKLAVRTDHIKILLHKLCPLQKSLIQHKPVTLLTGITADMLRYKIKYFLLAFNHNACAQICVLKSSSHGNMDVAVNDAGHNKSPAKIRDLSLIFLQPGLVAHIDEPAILYRKRRGSRIVPVRGKYLRVFNDLICFHFLLSFP